MTAPVTTTSSLRRSLTVWQAVGLSVALMAPSTAANINPQGTRFFPVVAFGWLALVTVATVALPQLTSRLSAGLGALDVHEPERLGG